MLWLAGCSTQITNPCIRTQSVRPKIFNPASYGIYIGKTSLDEITKNFKIIEIKEHEIELNPNDPHFEELQAERILVYLDKNSVITGMFVAYRNTRKNSLH